VDYKAEVSDGLIYEYVQARLDYLCMAGHLLASLSAYKNKLERRENGNDTERNM